MTTILDPFRPKAPAIREVCLMGDPTRKYAHFDPMIRGQGKPSRDRLAVVGRQGQPCCTGSLSTES